MAMQTILALLALLITGSFALPSSRRSTPGMIYAPVQKTNPTALNPITSFLTAPNLNGTVDLDLTDRAYTIGAYTVVVKVGTPPQGFVLQLDTGSSGTWLFSEQACNKAGDPKVFHDCGGIFIPKESETAVETKERYGELINQYGDGSFVAGGYFADTLDFGGPNGKVKNVTLGYAVDGKGPVYMGILGMGLRSLETVAQTSNKSYPTILETLQEQGAIASKSFSLYLNQIEGEEAHVILGGYDPSRIGGNLTVIPIMTDPFTGERNRYLVPLTGFGITAMDGGSWVDRNVKALSLPRAANLDSGTPLTRLPNDVFAPLARYFSAVKEFTGAYSVDCAARKALGWLKFEIAGQGDLKSGIVIETLLSDAVIQSNDMPAGRCLFGFMPTNGHAILGDTFLRAAYVVFDQDNMALGIAPSLSNQGLGQNVAFGKDGVLGVPGATILDGAHL